MTVVTPLLLTYLAHSTLLAGLAWLGARWIADPARRELLWRTALFGGLFTASLQVGASEWALETTRVPAPAWVVEDEPEPEPVALLTLGTPQGTGGPGFGAPPIEGPSEPASAAPKGQRVAPPSGWSRWIGGLWFVGAAFGLIALFFQHRGLRNRLARRGAMRGNEKALVGKLVGDRRAANIRVTLSRALTSPIALSASEICLPARGWEELGPDQQESMLAHEVAHVLRRDPLWFLLAQLVERIFFLQPLNVFLRRRMQSEAEYLCDDWAARRTGEPVALARCLATVAEWNEGRDQTVVLAPGMAAHPSTLVRRVERILERAAGGRETRGSRALFAGSLALGLAVFACSAPGIGDASGEEVEESRIVAEVRMNHPTDLRVEVEESGSARLMRADGEEEYGSFDLTKRDQRSAMQAALAEQAAKMPRGGPRTPGRAPSPIDSRLASGRLSIHLAEGARATQLQRILAMCAAFDVQIWDVEMVSSDGNLTYRVPLPVDLGIQPEEEIVEGEEVAFEDPGPRQGMLELQLRLDKAEGQAPRVKLRVNSDRYEYPADRDLTETLRSERKDVLEQVAEVLGQRHAENPGLVVSIDPRAGIVYGDVVALVDAVIEAGFTNIVFVGSYE